MQKLIDLISDRVAFEPNSGKVSSDVWKHFVCVKVDENKTDYVKCERGNGGMGTGIAATGTERERDSLLRERNGSGT